MYSNARLKRIIAMYTNWSYVWYYHHGWKSYWLDNENFEWWSTETHDHPDDDQLYYWVWRYMPGYQSWYISYYIII